MVKAMPKAQAVAPLDADEQRLLDDFEQDELRSIAISSLLEELREAAKGTGQKDQRINSASPAMTSRPSVRGHSKQASPISP